MFYTHKRISMPTKNSVIPTFDQPRSALLKFLALRDQFNRDWNKKEIHWSKNSVVRFVYPIVLSPKLVWLTQLPDLFTTTDFSAADLVLINLQSRLEFFFSSGSCGALYICFSRQIGRKVTDFNSCDWWLFFYMCFSAWTLSLVRGCCREN